MAISFVVFFRALWAWALALAFAWALVFGLGLWLWLGFALVLGLGLGVWLSLFLVPRMVPEKWRPPDHLLCLCCELGSCFGFSFGHDHGF